MTDTARTFTLDEARTVVAARDALAAAGRRIDAGTWLLEPSAARAQGITHEAIERAHAGLFHALSTASIYMDDPNAAIAVAVENCEATWPTPELALVPEPIAAIAVTPETQARFNAMLDADGELGSDAFVQWLLDLADAANARKSEGAPADELAELRDEVHQLARDLESTNRVLASRTEHLA